MINQKYPFVLPKLSYPYDSLEPYIDSETVHYHYDKHFKKYVDNLNDMIKKYPMYNNLTLIEILKNISSFPDEIKTKIRNNAGGVYNHYLYFKIMNPYITKGTNQNELLDKIKSQYGSIEVFLDELKTKAKEVFGSGYTFLVLNKFNNLELINTKDQNTPIELNLKPIFNIDLWEHAYYLKYKNLRDEYIDNYIKLINFDIVNQIYLNY